MVVCEATTAHRIFVANYVLVVVLVFFILSDQCGLPEWYGIREHPPVTPDGDLQYVSEHIMRCKYSHVALFRWLPWIATYSFSVMLMQAMYVWVSLHMIEAKQISQLQNSGAALHLVSHVLYVGVSFATLAGMLILVHFDHDFLPDARFGESEISKWTNSTHAHAMGVILMISGYMIAHLFVLLAYVVRVKSYHDFTEMCVGVEVDKGDWGLYRRGSYAGLVIFLLCLFCVFVILFIVDNTLVVLTEYVLLSIFVLVSVENLSISVRIHSVYVDC